jgi:hypothetical protein
MTHLARLCLCDKWKGVLEFEIRLKNKGCADRNASRKGAPMVWDRTQKVLLYRPAQGCALAGPLHFPLDKTVHKVATLLRRWPRTSAALGFGAAGTVLSILWWSPVIFDAEGMLPFMLFIVSPGVSAAVAGWTLGKSLLDSARICRPRSAALRQRVRSMVACGADRRGQRFVQ